MKTTTVVTLALLVSALSGAMGIFLGRSSMNNTASCRPSANAAPNGAAKRNIVWRVWNGTNDAPEDSPEKRLGNVLGLLIHPKLDPVRRNEAMVQFLNKSAFYFDKSDIESFRDMMARGDSAEIIAMLSRIVEAETKADDLIRAVLADKERVNRFLKNMPVPLEDGEIPAARVDGNADAK